jgi:large subunit ribosomal protein L10
VDRASKARKENVVASLKESLEHATCLVVTRQSGLTVSEVTELRRQMRSAGASYRVTKNRLALRALAATPFAPLSPLFTGPTAIAYSADAVAAAKVIVEFANRNSKLTVVGGGLAGRELDTAGIKDLAAMPSLDAARARVVGLMRTPAARLAALLMTPAGQMARLLAARAESGGEDSRD